MLAHASPTLDSTAPAQQQRLVHCSPAAARTQTSLQLQQQRGPQNFQHGLKARQVLRQALAVQLRRRSQPAIVHASSTSCCCAGRDHVGFITCASVMPAAALGLHTEGAITSLRLWSQQGSKDGAAGCPAATRRPSSRCKVSASELLPQQEATDSYQQQLCDVLHVSAAQARLVMLTSPDVVTLSREQLSTNWDTLQRLMPVKQHMLLQAILQLPDILVRPVDTVAARLAEASAVLQRPVQQLKSRQYKWTPLLHWSLVTIQRHQLVQKLVQMQQLLGLQQQQPRRQQSRQHSSQWQQEDQFQQGQQQQIQQVVSLLCDEPRLMNANPAQLVSSVEALEQVCAWPMPRLLFGILQSPALLMRSADQLYQAAATLQQHLKLSEEGLALALKRAPGALLVPADQLQGLLSELSDSLAVSTDVAADICLQEPQVLLRRPGGVGRVLTVLRSVFKLNSEELLQVVEFDPLVLCRSPGELSDSISKFRDASMASKIWAAEYK
eukprot:GHUV01030899.1.p1 GENE.GHUV01030899.1~~GHUV01030899.1.p1  ORF type:complete len:497 (+),score=185.49 GHUV01030899.1:427-1917(+)